METTIILTWVIEGSYREAMATKLELVWGWLGPLFWDLGLEV